ncbi:VQ motif-containing protein 8, chloroplastic-like [Actinidia eriantha]|uniref:VQ motif-containing protein 8, chloroplastic-like n=1 Tax=Actinidia eriantha TaxID=165200 RepID=UPI002586FDF6|nr:VQ motif-containing protein 8, chloroplastic-like [Actinidia eriantha]
MGPVRAINGPRPPKLRIKNDSHVISKKPNRTAEHGQNHHPIIIYAHSPKIIHAKPRDFMTLVQKLTGLSPRPQNHKSSSYLTDESAPASASASASARVSNSSETSSSSPNFDAAPNQFLADMPLFTPNSANFFLSPLLRSYADAVSALPNLTVSPSAFEAKKELPQY